eukprot:scaffold1486_cov329-Prasinococcus_capsulatus_cf.AAC.10
MYGPDVAVFAAVGRGMESAAVSSSSAGSRSAGRGVVSVTSKRMAPARTPSTTGHGAARLGVAAATRVCHTLEDLEGMTRGWIRLSTASPCQR